MAAAVLLVDQLAARAAPCAASIACPTRGQPPSSRRHDGGQLPAGRILPPGAEQPGGCEGIGCSGWPVGTTRPRSALRRQRWSRRAWRRGATTMGTPTRRAPGAPATRSTVRRTALPRADVRADLRATRAGRPANRRCPRCVVRTPRPAPSPPRRRRGHERVRGGVGLGEASPGSRRRRRPRPVARVGQPRRGRHAVLGAMHRGGAQVNRTGRRHHPRRAPGPPAGPGRAQGRAVVPARGRQVEHRRRRGRAGWSAEAGYGASAFARLDERRPSRTGREQPRPTPGASITNGAGAEVEQIATVARARRRRRPAGSPTRPSSPRTPPPQQGHVAGDRREAVDPGRPSSTDAAPILRTNGLPTAARPADREDPQLTGPHPATASSTTTNAARVSSAAPQLPTSRLRR